MHGPGVVPGVECMAADAGAWKPTPDPSGLPGVSGAWTQQTLRKCPRWLGTLPFLGQAFCTCLEMNSPGMQKGFTL